VNAATWTGAARGRTGEANGDAMRFNKALPGKQWALSIVRFARRFRGQTVRSRRGARWGKTGGSNRRYLQQPNETVPFGLQFSITPGLVLHSRSVSPLALPGGFRLIAPLRRLTHGHQTEPSASGKCHLLRTPEHLASRRVWPLRSGACFRRKMTVPRGTPVILTSDF